MKLRCSSSECETRRGDNPTNPLFNATIAFGRDRDIAEDVVSISAEDFTCLCCGADAEDDPDGEVECGTPE